TLPIVDMITGDIAIVEPSRPITIIGKVINEKNNPIASASVMIKGTNEGIYTDQRGTFSIQIQSTKKDGLSFSLVGYEIKDFEINNYTQGDTLIVQLESLPFLGEVLVIRTKPIVCNSTTTEISPIIKKSNDEIIPEIKDKLVNSFKVF